MTRRPKLRSFIGTILIILIVSVYALLATTIATATLATAPWWAHLLYFLLTGLLWVIPAMLVIKWMAGPFKKKDAD
ncbi:MULTISPECIES: DUF2842 domain-containing protein [Rhizobium/Agrobacterium group]|jgi:hypothetical protein|uniref:DUF2842 domain-containing protein n=1 Tax=Rhizobium/Agrobacterium group TaxID=227290 RepID=UPI00083DB95B|nr:MULTISPECIES: DUF2842 domain-containing protein [Rhizobium/Agrobacterium group]MDM7981193.1 DUF2842 domain-containing protein [Rhizobium sp.]AOG09278.1 hypothetical protein BSY240_1135 [Agrobacterium sp. RAC06]MDM8014973.1 DUF2842 domain-containing protein [Rhizobium sp.]MDZ7874958.1 DUF2842 domain-containing protein [Rhizobium sp.]SIQ53904.1 Protein of unknown function [Rhizobium sp. RU33A]